MVDRHGLLAITWEGTRFMLQPDQIVPELDKLDICDRARRQEALDLPREPTKPEDPTVPNIRGMRIRD